MLRPTLIACPDCACHVRAGEGTCPHCAATLAVATYGVASASSSTGGN
ncbi:MAG: hypothetical protein U0414_26735 [Polyangiaceae bacterium]